MCLMQAHYNLLGLTTGCTKDDIKSAYRRLAKKYHPDINPSGAEAFRAITTAYNWLMDNHIQVEPKKPIVLNGKKKIYRFSRDLAFDLADDSYIIRIWKSDSLNDGIIFIMDKDFGEIRLEYKANVKSGSKATLKNKVYKILVMEDKEEKTNF